MSNNGVGNLRLVVQNNSDLLKNGIDERCKENLRDDSSSLVKWAALFADIMEKTFSPVEYGLM
jgi:hypothetical protein